MDQCGQVNILVLDRDEETQKVFRSIGSENGYTVDFVAEAYVALLRIVKGQLPDIFFIQPALAGNSAYELCQVASKNKIAVVMMDNEATPEKVALAARAGARDFLLKSAGEKIIAGKIRRILEHQGKIAPKAKKFSGIDFGNKELTALEKIVIIMEKAQEVVAMPNSVAKVIALCRNEKVGAAEIVKPLTSDPALSSLILKRSNSAAYASVERVKDLKSAVTRIGAKETKNICVAVSVFNLFDKQEKSFGFNRFNYWIHCLSVGIIAQWIARKANFPAPEDALLVGLLHDIGKMILDDYLNQDYQKVIQLAATEKKSMNEAENEVLKTTHFFIGGRIAEVWKFHQDITDTIKNHHNYDIAFPGEGNRFNLSTFVYLGNNLAKAMMLGTGGDYLVSVAPDAVFSRLGFEKAIPRDFIDDIYNDLEEFFQILNIPNEMRPKRIAPESQEKRILMLGSGRVANGFARLYLTNQGYRVTLVEEMGKDKDPNYDLIIYDCPETVSPEKKEIFIQLAKKNAHLPAVFLQGNGIDIAELQKFHKEPEVLSLPMDVFVLDQIIKKIFSE